MLLLDSTGMCSGSLHGLQLQEMPNLEVLSLSVNRINSLRDFQYCKPLHPEFRDLYWQRVSAQLRCNRGVRSDCLNALVSIHKSDGSLLSFTGTNLKELYLRKNDIADLAELNFLTVLIRIRHS